MNGERPDWVARLQALADQPPTAPRQPLCLAHADAVVGSIEPPLAQRMSQSGLPLHEAGGAWCVTGDADTSLAAISHWLHTRRLAGRWRDELLAVALADGTAVAAIERAAVRPLGIATQAVHLVGHVDDGTLWVQQRALDKATDPGRWDTLMGGLMAAGESVAQTLERETWEEAGLRLDQLLHVARLGSFTVRRPVAGGYMVEHTHLAEALVPLGVVPVNQDGEVLRFECITQDVLAQRLRAGDFTLEASLVLFAWLQRDAHLGGQG